MKWVTSLIPDSKGSDYHGPRDAGGLPQSQYKEQLKQGKGKVTFPAPTGFNPPVGMEKGQKFRVLAEVYMTDEGKLCLDSIDGKTLDSDAEPIEIKNDNILMETLKYRLPPTGLPSD